MNDTSLSIDSISDFVLQGIVPQVKSKFQILALRQIEVSFSKFYCYYKNNCFRINM